MQLSVIHLLLLFNSFSCLRWIYLLSRYDLTGSTRMEHGTVVNITGRFNVEEVSSRATLSGLC